MQRDIKIKSLENYDLSIIPLLIDIGNGNFFKDPEKPTTTEIISLVAQYTGERFGEVSKWEFKSLKSVFMKIIDQFNEYQPKEPKRTIRIGERVFKLIEEPQKQSAGWWHHFEQITPHTDTASFLGLVYMEEGFQYAETDERGNIMNPTSERGELIEENFKASEFLDLMGFFLRRFEVLRIATFLEGNPETRMRLRKILNPINGKELFT